MGYNPVGRLPAAGTNPVRYLPTTKYNHEGGHALISSHPAEMGGAQHGDVCGDHAQPGALPTEGRHQGVGQPQHEDVGRLPATNRPVGCLPAVGTCHVGHIPTNQCKTTKYWPFGASSK